MFIPNELIKQSIVCILQNGPRGFTYILRRCHSLFPDMLQDALEIMIQENLVAQKAEKYVLPAEKINRWDKLKKEWSKRINNAESIQSKISARIHLPHPLDYEWWFAPSNYRVLARKLILENPLPLPKSIAFLGSPTLGAYISSLIPDATIYILDKSSNTLKIISECVPKKNLKNVALRCYNAEDSLPSELIGVVQMVVCDPPWYVDYYDAFFRRCVLLTQGKIATIFTSLFPLFLRPDLPLERNQLFSAALKYGLIPMTLESMVTQYATPMFEKQALKSKAIGVNSWQRGDLATFVSNGEIAPDNIDMKLETDEWKTVTIEQTKVKIRVKTDEPTNVCVAPTIILHHDEKTILRAVSRRNPHRNEIDLWTSTHIRLRVSGWKAVWRIVEGIAQQLNNTAILASIRNDYIDGSVFPPDLEAKVRETIEVLRKLLHQP